MNRGYEKYSKNPYEIPRVVLASISDEIQLDENLEPPFTRTRSGNTANLFIDVASGTPLTVTPADRICSAGTALSRINRLYLTFLSFRWFTPNINPRNNVFSFVWTITGQTYVITLAQNNLLGLARWQYLVAAMNTAVGIANFTVGPALFIPNTYTITSTAGTFYFNEGSSGVDKGRFLWGFSNLNTGPASVFAFQTFTYFTENYTRYIDVSSFELTQYSKCDSGGNAVPSDILIRYNVNTTQYGQYEYSTITTPVSINFSRERNITSVDIHITDEFNDLLYIVPEAWSTFSFNITLVCEM
jgi:hypothetical protein